MASDLKECTCNGRTAVGDTTPLATAGQPPVSPTSDVDLPSWALRALESSPSSPKDFQYSERSTPSHFQDDFPPDDPFIFDASDHLPGPSPSPSRASMDGYDIDRGEHPLDRAYGRLPPHSISRPVPSLPAYPTTTRMDAQHCVPYDVRGVWSAQATYRGGATSQMKTTNNYNNNHSYSNNGIFHGDYANFAASSHSNSSSRSMGGAYHRAYVRGYEMNGRCYDGVTLSGSGSRYLPAVADDLGPSGSGEVVYSQGRPLMAPHAHRDRILAQQYYPYPVYRAPTLLHAMADHHQHHHPRVPMPIRPSPAGEYFRSSSAFYKAPPSDVHPFIPSISQFDGRLLIDESQMSRLYNFETTPEGGNVSLPLQVSPEAETFKQQNSSLDADDKKTSFLNRSTEENQPFSLAPSLPPPLPPHPPPSLTPPSSDEAKEKSESKTEIRNQIDQSICETGKPNLTSSPPAGSQSKPPRAETTKADDLNAGDRSDKSPVAYTILFSPKDEVAKPPELTERRFAQRAKSQERSSFGRTLSEVKKTSAASKASRDLPTKQKPEKTNAIPERQSRPSRPGAKTTTTTTSFGMHDNNNWLSRSFNESYLREDRSCGDSVAKKPFRLRRRKSPEVQMGSISDEGEMDAVSESGTYVIDAEGSRLKAFREDIPHVFGVDSKTRGDENGEEEKQAFRNKFFQPKSLESSVDPRKQDIREGDKKSINSVQKSLTPLPSRRVLPEAPEATQDKATTRRKPKANESFDSITKWLTNSALISAKPPPSAANVYSARSALAADVDKEESPSGHGSRRAERSTQNANVRAWQNPPGQRENFHNDPTAMGRELSGRRSVDPLLRSFKTKTNKTGRNPSCDEGVPSQMSKSWISNGSDAALNASTPPSRPTRPRSTSRPRMPKTPLVGRKQTTPSIEPARSGTESEASLPPKPKPTVSERICAPTIATELKSKKTPPVPRDFTPVPRNTTPVHNSSLEEVSSVGQARPKRRISRSKTLDADEFASNVAAIKTETSFLDVSSNSDEKTESSKKSTGMSQKVAKLTEKFLRETEELLKDSGADSRQHSGLEEIVTHLKAHPIADANILAAVSNLLKLQVHSSDKNDKVPTKEYRETTF